MTSIHFSSKSNDWQTPKSLIDDLAEVFDWDIDVCASTNNVCDNYFNIEIDGLAQEWTGLCWMNPPYGREIKKWISKAANSFATTVCLVPARTDTRWFHENIEEASLVVFFNKRPSFIRDGYDNKAPVPAVFIVFGGLSFPQTQKLKDYGWAIENK